MLEHIDDDNFQDFLFHPHAFLFIGKEECDPCNRWTNELTAHLLEGNSPDTNVGLSATPSLAQLDFRWGKVTLGKGKLTNFKRVHGIWLSQVRDLPHNTLWINGDLSKEWTGGGLDRLTSRLQNLGILPIT
jgi:hypothetical protein